MPVFGSRIYAWWQCCWWCCCVVPLWYVWIEQTAVPRHSTKTCLCATKTSKLFYQEKQSCLCATAWTFYVFFLFACECYSLSYITQCTVAVSMYTKRSRLFPSLPLECQVTRLGLIPNYIPREGGLNWGEKLLWNIVRTTIDVSLLFCKLGVTGWPVNWRWLHLHSQSWGPKKRVTFASWCCFWRTRYIHRILV